MTEEQRSPPGFRINLGVRHPQRPLQYILAVECDGATYHSALWARERDRRRQQVLEHQGWHFHRIWSTDWFYRRELEVGRLRLALAQAQEEAAGGFRPPTATRHQSNRNSAEANGRSGRADDGALPRTAPPRTHEVPPEPPEAPRAPAYKSAISTQAPSRRMLLRLLLDHGERIGDTCVPQRLHGCYIL